jgi:hypothetical protein
MGSSSRRAHRTARIGNLGCIISRISEDVDAGYLKYSSYMRATMETYRNFKDSKGRARELNSLQFSTLRIEAA